MICELLVIIMDMVETCCPVLLVEGSPYRHVPNEADTVVHLTDSIRCLCTPWHFDTWPNKQDMANASMSTNNESKLPDLGRVVTMVGVIPANGEVFRILCDIIFSIEQCF